MRETASCIHFPEPQSSLRQLCPLQGCAVQQRFGNPPPSWQALRGGCRSVGINATRKSFSAAGWPGKVSGKSENHHLFYVAPPRRGGSGATFLVPSKAPGTDLAFCLPPKGLKLRRASLTATTPGLADGATTSQSSGTQASHHQPVAARDSPFRAGAGIKLQEA